MSFFIGFFFTFASYNLVLNFSFVFACRNLFLFNNFSFDFFSVCLCVRKKKKKMMVGWNAAHLFWDDYLFILRRGKKTREKSLIISAVKEEGEEAVQSILNRPSRSR